MEFGKTVYSYVNFYPNELSEAGFIAIASHIESLGICECYKDSEEYKKIIKWLKDCFENKNLYYLDDDLQDVLDKIEEYTQFLCALGVPNTHIILSKSPTVLTLEFNNDKVELTNFDIMNKKYYIS